MNDTITTDLLAVAVSAIAAVSCLAAAFALVSLIRMNKGAKLNHAWGLVAFGSGCLGLVALDRTVELLGMPNAGGTRDALTAFGSLFIMIGAVYARGIYRNLLK